MPRQRLAMYLCDVFVNREGLAGRVDSDGNDGDSAKAGHAKRRVKRKAGPRGSDASVHTAESQSTTERDGNASSVSDGQVHKHPRGKRRKRAWTADAVGD